MTINELIKDLIRLKERFGDFDIQFECPHCEKYLTPVKESGIKGILLKAKQVNSDEDI